MKILLTSFGTDFTPKEKSANQRSWFQHLPPLKPALAGDLWTPDYASLLLADQIVIDTDSYERLTHSEAPVKPMAEMLEALHDEGFIHLENYQEILTNATEQLLSETEADITDLTKWFEPIEASMVIWKESVQAFRENMRTCIHDRLLDWNTIKPLDFLDFNEEKVRKTLDGHERRIQEFNQLDSELANKYMHGFYGAVAKRTSEMIQSYRHGTISVDDLHILENIIRKYVQQINSNLFLSQSCDCPLLDWPDYSPFYMVKLTDDPHIKHNKVAEKIEELFTISFPEFTFWSAKKVIAALKHPAIKDLRALVNEAVEGRITFNEEFGRQTLMKAFSRELSVGKMRKITSYATIPAGLIPVIGPPVQKVSEEVITSAIESKMKQNDRWFYLISTFVSE